MPNLMWQCDSCDVSNYSHSKTDEIMKEISKSVPVVYYGKLKNQSSKGG